MSLKPNHSKQVADVWEMMRRGLDGIEERGFVVSIDVRTQDAMPHAIDITSLKSVGAGETQIIEFLPPGSIGKIIIEIEVLREPVR